MRRWFAFIFLAVFGWGPSFMWIKIALQDIGPIALTMYRMAFGALTAWALMKALHLPVRYTKQRLLGSMVVGVLGLAIPMSLLSWGETRIDSGLAGILNGTVPLWTFIFAHYFLHDEKITPAKAFGLVVGFLGLVVLVSRDLDWEGLRSGSIWGQVAVIGMAISYAASMVFTRRFLKGQHPVHTAAISISTSFVVLLPLTLILEPAACVPHRHITWLACGWMGVVGLALALWVYYHLLNEWGATRTSLVTYVVPIVAVALGAIFLNEHITWHLLVGGALIIAGIGLVNRKKRLGT